MTIEPNIHKPDCNISPDELYCLVFVGVVPAVAELDQLLVGELVVPHDAGHSFQLIGSTTFTASARVQCPELIAAFHDALHCSGYDTAVCGSFSKSLIHLYKPENVQLLL